MRPIQNSTSAKTHTPLYTVHRYFARRPHNVFRHLLRYYLRQPNQLVLDPFAGGGVSVVEALSLGHRCIAFEINDLAAFIIRNELTFVDSEKLNTLFLACLKRTYSEVGRVYQYNGREIYWIQWVSYTCCPNCSMKTSLSPTLNTKAGVYRCEHCNSNFRPKLVHSRNIEPLGICLVDKGSSLSGIPQNPEYKEIPLEKLIRYEMRVKGLLKNSPYNLGIEKKMPIPECNLKKESALHKKGICYFEDFFPYRSQAWIQSFASSIVKCGACGKYREIMYYILSAALRYISRFSTRNSSWRGKYKPLEWAKSNFWTPYAFVETNPFLAIWERYFSYQRALSDLQNRFPVRKPLVGSVNSVLSGTRSFAVANRSSERMVDIPDQSVDFILTDPPYGSYVHYGELSGYWLCWLSKFNHRFKNSKPVKKSEAVPSRKKYKNCKTFKDYERILTSIFSECYRVLKNGRYMVLTFNNKEPEAWIALLRAIKKVKFMLPKGGVIFQDGVEVYKRTIDLRREGAIHGDFIYTFRKGSGEPRAQGQFDWREQAEKLLLGLRRIRKPISNSELYIQLNYELIPRLYDALDPEATEIDHTFDDFSFQNLERCVQKHLERKNGFWIPK